MTTCQFNNLSSLCTAIFSERRGQLYTCYYLSISLKKKKKTSIQFPLSKIKELLGQNIFLLWARQIEFKLEGVQVFSFGDRSSMTWPHHSSIITAEFHKTYFNSISSDTNLRNRSNSFYYSRWGGSKGKGWGFSMAEVHTWNSWHFLLLDTVNRPDISLFSLNL